MLVTFYSCALESRRPGALIRDPRAESLVERIDYDFARFEMDADDQAAACLRLRQFVPLVGYGLFVGQKGAGGNATMRLKTGDRVRVDGGRGVVEML